MTHCYEIVILISCRSAVFTAHRLSALVAKCFHQALDFIPVDDRKIAETLSWLINIQASNGSFSEPPGGRVSNRAMQVFALISYEFRLGWQ